jgi:hypothetical protein
MDTVSTPNPEANPDIDDNPPNEVETPLVDESFIIELIGVKGLLYENIITPNIDPSTNQAQDVNRLQKYEYTLQVLREILQTSLLLHSFNPFDKLMSFPEETRKPIESLVINMKKNSANNASAYKRIIMYHCSTNPYMRVKTNIDME